MLDVNFELVKYAITQGGLTLLCLAIAWSYRRDLLRKQKVADATIEILTTLVEKNTKAYARLTRALERRRLLTEDDDDDQ